MKIVVNKFPKTKDAFRQPIEDSPFHCCEQWHLAGLLPICSLIYPLAYRISQSKGKQERGGPKGTLHCSAESLAAYFGRKACTVQRGLKKLRQLGFLELLDARKFKPNVYRVLSHKEWALEHPGMCATRLSFPYSAECDLLGQALWNVSGGRVEFQPHSVNNIRKLDLPEETVLKTFEEYWKNIGKEKPAKMVPIDFYIQLKKTTGQDEQKCAA